MKNESRLSQFSRERTRRGTAIKLQNDYATAYLKGKDENPHTVADVLMLLNHYVPDGKASTTRPLGPGGNRPANRQPAVSFLQASDDKVLFMKGTNGTFHATIICHLCGVKGHYKSHCPVCVNENGDKLQPSENVNTQGTGQEVSTRFKTCVHLSQVKASHINPYWILLDSESSDHVFCNSHFLSDVQDNTDGEVLRLISNGGFLDIKQKGNFGDISTWYHPGALANVLSLGMIIDQYRVTMDSDIEKALILHVSEGIEMRFIRIQRNLFVYDASNVDLPKLIKSFTFLNTVEQNKQMFKAREVRKAEEAVTLNRRINHPAKDKFIRLVQNNWIRNCPVTVGDVRRSHIIYGPPLPPIIGRTKYQESPRIKDNEIVQLPKELFEDLKHVTLCIDFHFVNRVAVLHSISRRRIDYRTVSFPLSRSRTSMLTGIAEIQQKYHAQGFRIVDIHGDNEFEKVKNDMLPVRVQCCGTDEHVPEVERSIQTQKNENRTVCHAMPYKCMPRVMVRAIVKQGNAFLNAFGTKESMSNGLSPRNIIDNLPHVDYNDLKYEFGEYVHLHVREQFTNTMKYRTIGAIVLDPRNLLGRYDFMSLETGAIVNGRVVARLPVTADVIARVEQLGLEQEQPYRATKMLQYKWRIGQPVSDDDVLEETPPPEMMVPDPIVPKDPAPNPFSTPAMSAQQGAEEEKLMVVKTQSHFGNDQGATKPTTLPPTERSRPSPSNDLLPSTKKTENDDSEEVASESLEDDDDEIDDGDGDDEEDENEGADEREGAFEPQVKASTDEDKVRRGGHWTVGTGRNYGRGRRTKKRHKPFSPSMVQSGEKRRNVKGKTTESLSFLQTEFKSLEDDQRKEFFSTAMEEFRTTGKTTLMERYTTGLLFAQMTSKQGIAKYGREAEIKLLAEFKQLMEYKIFHGRKASELTLEQKKKAANMINLIEEKINRGHTDENPVLRGRSVFNGSVQKGLYSKEETASPTVSVDAVFITCIVAALQGREKAVTDIKGAYLNARMKDKVIMKITGPDVRLFCEIDERLAKYITIEKGKEVLYVQLDKALYGCVQSALLWYELYSTTLMDIGFELNPYDACVANAVIDGEQCTVCWYVDDNIITHAKKEVIEDIIRKIEAKFGSMSKEFGDDQDFLGMSIKFKKKKFSISMKKHIVAAFKTFKEEVTRSAATPAKSYLFEVREGAKKLDDEYAENFHKVVAALLFVSRRCRLDIQTAIGFLCTRVSEPDEDDWAKLRRVMQYLRGTIDLVLTLGADDITKMKAWVDVSYGVHADCKSHTGGCISFGWGVLLTMCQKQKLNVKSSTEGEIVGVSDYMPNMIWARMFMGAQGIDLEENILFQDNQSTIKIEQNGKRSSGKRTKHMDNRYFWIKDRLESEKIRVEYCPTAVMVADFFTKPLQGSLFRKLRDVVMGCVHIDSLKATTEELPSQERVGKDGSDSGPSDVRVEVES